MELDEYEHSMETYPEFSDYHRGEEIYLKKPRGPSKTLEKPISKGSAGPAIIGSLTAVNESFANFEITEKLMDQFLIIILFVIMLILIHLIRSVATLSKDIKKIKEMLKIISMTRPTAN